MFSLDFVLLMLAAGAAVGMIAALLGLPLILQVLLAAGAAVLSLAVIRPTVVKRLHQGPELQLGHAKLIGQRAVVLEEITSTQAGLIKLDGEQWTARPYDESLASRQVRRGRCSRSAAPPRWCTPSHASSDRKSVGEGRGVYVRED